jgi:hypothetical protein
MFNLKSLGTVLLTSLVVTTAGVATMRGAEAATGSWCTQVALGSWQAAKTGMRGQDVHDHFHVLYLQNDCLYKVNGAQGNTLIHQATQYAVQNNGV